MYSAKYQAPTTLEHVALIIHIIPLATARLQNEMANVPTSMHVNAIPNVQYFRFSSNRQIVSISVTKGRFEIHIRRRLVGD